MERDKNPLLKKYLNEGNLPTTYLTPERRKDIYDFMRLKVNCAPAENSTFSTTSSDLTTLLGGKELKRSQAASEANFKQTLDDAHLVGQQNKAKS